MPNIFSFNNNRPSQITHITSYRPSSSSSASTFPSSPTQESSPHPQNDYYAQTQAPPHTQSAPHPPTSSPSCPTLYTSPDAHPPRAHPPKPLPPRPTTSASTRAAPPRAHKRNAAARGGRSRLSSSLRTIPPAAVWRGRKVLPRLPASRNYEKAQKRQQLPPWRRDGGLNSLLRWGFGRWERKRRRENARGRCKCGLLVLFGRG